LQNLPKTQRSVFILKYFNELSHQEISDILGISLSSSKTNFHYAVKSLKNMISGGSK
jgi:RNA polymerase sigma-70 factor (ECF subfamily)